MDLEPPTGNSPGWSGGVLVEGRVTGATWDMLDAADDGLDTVSANFNAIRRALGYDDCSVLPALHQNTIDFDDAPHRSNLPDLTVGEDTANPRIVDLWEHANDPE